MITLYERKTPLTRAVLAPKATQQRITLRQFAPVQPAEAPWLAHVWSVAWSLPDGNTQTQSTAPFPAFNLVADLHRGAALFGCPSSRFDYTLSGTGRVLGLRLQPGGQAAFWPGKAANMTDTALHVTDILPPRLARRFTAACTTAPDLTYLSNLVTELAQTARPLSAPARQIAQIVAYIEATPNLFRVSDICQAFDLSDRHLQRLFRDHLGLAPKPVIDRFRMHDALQSLHAPTAPDLAQLSVNLGYTDQAHFSNRFKRLTGISPGQYIRRDH